ncbi:UNVERIFIED_CONTAM: protein RDM16 [Sesamum calycinum]|uniref:Protein RDM16 n=1 Tax=Sesamum calycinum TaxID=2727403 RepID=A0AAW2LS21_9LAMI
MDKENSNRKRRESDSHRDRESSKEHHHRSKHDDDRRRSDEHHRRRSDSRAEREGSRDRDSRRERERSHSVERKKRKERGESEERSDKRTRVYEENGREKSRFEDVKVKDDDRERKEGEGFGSEGKSVKKDAKYESRDSGHQSKTGSVANSLATGPVSTPSSISPETFVAHTSSPATKVSSISKTNENKGVNINRSHEVPGKSSTDGTASDAGKTGGLSLDALAKAKRALQMQKELAERMKKIPSLNRDAGSTREGSPQVGEKEVAKLSSSGKGIMPMPVPQVTTSLTGTSGVTSSAPTLPIVTSAPTMPPQGGMPHLPGLTAQKYEAVKRAQELAAKMGFRQDPEFAPLINMFPGQMPPDVTIQPKPSKAPVLRLDALGREIDEHGNVVNVPKVNSLSTLKVNINKQKKDAFQILKPELDVDPDENPHFDARMGIDKNKLLRPKRMTFQFVEEGKWSRDAEIIKLKSQFGEAKAKELKVKQAQLAKAKAEPDINPNLIEVGERVITKEKPKESIPDVEWWDVPFLQSGTYGDIVDGNIREEIIKMEKITIYVEHPRPIEPPAEPAPPPPQPLKLTKKEQKKLRTQRRLAREKDRQEMIRLGVVEPPKPKVKMSNLMKVLGSEATQDPTKLEMEIRSAAAEREQAHIDRNIAQGISVVVVEGGAKSIKRYGKLMLRRIDWTAAVKKEEDEEDDDEDKPLNKCVLVWQGSVAKPSFTRFSVQECRTETAARKFFSDHGVGHYWDLAVNFTEDDPI